MIENIRRITVHEVKAAMEKTGAVLKRKTTLMKHSNGLVCGCPIGIVAFSIKDPIPNWCSAGVEDCQRIVGLEDVYCSGFIGGFDGLVNGPIHISNDIYTKGYADGRAVAEALLPKSDNR